MTSKVYLFRHGETEWSKNGRHTGKTDLPLTAAGERRIKNSANRIIGEDGLIIPSNIKHIYVSPRQRAKKTLELLCLPSTIPIEETEAIAEWDYGDYEGLTSEDINVQREGAWNVFQDGCPGGDSAQTVTARLGRLISQIRDLHRLAASEHGRADVLIVAHGHILRAFAALWIRDTVANGTRLAYGAGGASVLSYEHHSLDEPTIEVWNVTDLTLK